MVSGSRTAIALAVAVAVIAASASAQPPPTAVTHVMPNERCRMQSGSAHGYCGLPYELSNFQGRHECDDRVWIGRPTSVLEMQQMVAMADKAQGLGVGHSWYKDLFCPAHNASGIGIVTTELSDLRVPIPVASISDGYSNPLGEGVAYAPEFPSDYPIWVNERDQTVRVAAGVSQRTLLDYLSTYKGPSDLADGKGWSLPAFSWFIDQTIAGAVATNTHGSSLQHGSLSDQVVSFQVVVANGSLVEISHETHPHLMRAMKVNVGRLGIVTEMTMKIIPQTAVRRTLETLDWVGYVTRMKSVQNDYLQALQTGRVENVKRALKPIWDTQIQYHAALGQVWWASYERLEDTSPYTSAFDGPGATAQVTNIFNQDYFAGTPPSFMMATMNNARFWNNWFQGVIRGNFASGTFPQRRAYVSLSDGQNRMHAMNPYDQYEVSIPLATAGDCLEELGRLMYGPYALWTGTRTPFLTRFVKGEDAYLSNNNGGPRMHVNLEDFVLYSTGARNAAFQGIMNFFRTNDKCQARLHWGKAGWIEHGQCFDGAKEYPDSWCDFGCAAQELDPTRKFESLADFWHFRASKRDSASSVPRHYDLLTPAGWSACCTKDGFKRSECKCVERPPCSK